MPFYPSVEEILQRTEGDSLLEVRRSLRSILSNIALFLIALLAVYLINMFFYDAAFLKNLPLIGDLSLRWLGVIPVVFLLEIIRKYHDDLYVFGFTRITHHEGRLSLRSSLPSLEYVDIRAIKVAQDIIGRIFDYGNVVLSSAGQEGDEMVLGGVRRPGELSELVEELRRRSLMKSGIEAQQVSKSGE